MRKAGIVGTLLSILLLAAPAAYGQVNYGDLIGSGVDFLQVTETTQTPPDPAVLWGAPALDGTGMGLLFFPNTFTSSCAAGSSDITSSQLETTIMAQGANTIDVITLVESGDVILTKFPPFGDPTTNASASLGGFLTVIEDTGGPIVPVVIPFAGTFVPTGTFSLPGDFGARTWQGSFTIDVANHPNPALRVPNATKAILQLNNTLDSNCGAGATSGLIEKKSVGGPTIALIINPVECSLAIDKTCCIPQPAAPGVDICDGKVERLVLDVVGGDCDATTNDQEGKAKCTGPSPVLDPDDDMVTVTVTKDEDKVFVNGQLTPLVVDLGDVDTLEFTHIDGELKASTKFEISGPGGDQELTVHTSCSKALGCNDQFGSVQVVEVETTDGGTTICTDPDAEGTQCVQQTAAPFACEDKIASITFEWTGAACPFSLPNPQEGKAECDGNIVDAEPVSVTYTGKDADKISVENASNIDIGEQFSLTATGRDDLKASTKLLAQKLQDPGKGIVQAVEIHTSCSKAINCGDEFGGFKVISILGTDGTTCDLTPPGPLFQTACEVPLTPPTPHCTSKVLELQLAYIGDIFGEGCTVSNSQDGNASCTGVDDPGSPVSVTITKDPDKVFADPDSGINAPNGTVDIISIFKEEGGVRKELGSSTEFDVTGPLPLADTQSIKIHTSCSKPLNLGDRFGSFAVVGIDRKDDGFIGLGGQVEYQYKVTNNSDEDAIVNVTDDPLGDIAIGETVGAGEMETFFVTKTLFASQMNTATVAGMTTPSGAVCEPVDSLEVDVTVTLPPQGSFDCSDAKPIDELSMKWAGGVGYMGNVCVKAYDGDVGDTLLDTVDNVAPGDIVTIDGMGGSPNNQQWAIYAVGCGGPLLGTSQFHISCSDSNMNGIEDCGKPQGNGKDDDPALADDWLLEGMNGDQELDCTPDPIVMPTDFVPSSCGLGFELAFLLPGLLWLRGRRQRLTA